jgi:DMSO reductase anchor subunit
LSREILTFGAFAPAAFVEAMRSSFDFPLLKLAPPWSAVAVGMLSVFCSVTVYVDTRRPWWSMKWTGPKFLGTVLAGGLGLAACYDASFTLPAAITSAVKLGWETLYLSSDDPRDKRSQRLLLGQMRHLHGARFLVGVLGCVLTLALPVQGFCLFVIGEFLERKIFFRAAAAWKMPGNA